MRRAVYGLGALFVFAGCSPANVFELREYSSMLIPDFDGVTTVAVEDVTNNTFLPSPFSGDGEHKGGWAEELRVVVGGETLGRSEMAKIGHRLEFEVDGVSCLLRVEGFEIHTFSADSVTLLFYRP